LNEVFTTVDIVVFLAALALAMIVGLIASANEKTSEDYFLAGRKIPWWGVAGSIFGSNVSANHMVGMMGIGFSIGFAQSHFEIGAIAGLMMLCYGFLPVYRRLQLYTLSEYLEKRYDNRSRISYAVIMVLIMAVLHLVPGLYIGARSMCVLAGDIATTEVPAGAAIEQDDDTIARAGKVAVAGLPAWNQPAKSQIKVKQSWYIGFVIALAVISATYTIFGGLNAVVWTDFIQSLLLLGAGIVVALLTFYALGGWNGWSEMMALDDAAGDARKMRLYLPVNHPSLPWTGVFTGLMAMHCFYWGTNQFIVQRALGARSDAEARLGIIAAGFLKLLIPFFAIASGIAAFYWFQTHLSGQEVAPDTAFTEIVKRVVPLGWGIVGLIAAGLIGAILSSIDSMMNSAATIVTIDIYQRYIHPDASDKQMIFVGRLSIVGFVVMAAFMAIFVLNPDSKSNFFLQIADYQNYLTPGLLVAFAIGMVWKGGTRLAGFLTIIAGVVFSGAIEQGYDRYVGADPVVYSLAAGDKSFEDVPVTAVPEHLRNKNLDFWESYLQTRKETLQQSYLGVSRWDVIGLLGPKLNFFHRVVGVILLCGGLYFGISLMGKPDPEKGKLTWTGVGGHNPRVLRAIATAFAVSLLVYVSLAVLMVYGEAAPVVMAWCGAIWTFLVFLGSVLWTFSSTRADRIKEHQMRAAKARGKRARNIKVKDDGPTLSETLKFVFTDDRFWAGILCGAAVFMLYYFY